MADAFITLVVMMCAALSAAAASESLGMPRRTVNHLNSSLIDVVLNAPPRYMWGWGPGLSGYCGATSFQTNGIFWGEWLSSEKVRTADGGSELLIAVNDQTAAKALKFLYEEWSYNQKTPQGTAFVQWLKGHVDQGHIIAIGVYEMLPSGSGDQDYDHIVPVVGYQYDSSSGDVTGIYFNDLWSPETRMLSVPSSITSRSQCTQATTPQQPYTYCLTGGGKNGVDYGIAFLGNVDTNSETYRTTLTMPSWTEPDYGKEDHVNAKPVNFTVTATIAGLTVGESYTVYRFDSYTTLPSKNFPSGPFTNSWTFVAAGSEQVLSQFDTFMSNSTIFYRTVKA